MTLSVHGRPGGDATQNEAADAVLLVDVANVVGSRPDGWWRDRAAAASGLLASLASLRGTTVLRPGGESAVRLSDVVAVVEGAARSAVAPDGVAVVSAVHDGDSEVVAQARRIRADGNVPLVVTADRGLRIRLPVASVTAGPEWPNRLLGAGRIAALRADARIDFLAMVDPAALGFQLEVIMHVKVEPQRIEATARALAATRQVRYVSATTGAGDLTCDAVFRDSDDLYEFLTTTVGKLRGVLSIDTDLVLEAVKRAYYYPLFGRR
jgi:hypothetical protein